MNADDADDACGRFLTCSAHLRSTTSIKGTRTRAVQQKSAGLRSVEPTGLRRLESLKVMKVMALSKVHRMIAVGGGSHFPKGDCYDSCYNSFSMSVRRYKALRQ